MTQSTQIIKENATKNSGGILAEHGAERNN